MNPQEQVALSKYSTMGLGGTADYLMQVENKEQLKEALDFAKSKNIPSLMIGTGSNIVWLDEGYRGLVLVSNIKGISLDWQDENSCLVKIGSGEIWDQAVEHTVSSGLSGIEALSLIPGKAGATPVQNVGAYGQEIADSFVSLEAYDSQTGELVTLYKEDCGFGYRTSRFKNEDHGRFYIISITLKLSKTTLRPPFYRVLGVYLEEHNITDYSPEAIRRAVIDIRETKLPDPNQVHNVGSFFANPVIALDEANKLREAYQNIPVWPAGENLAKIPAAWLIERAGFKDYHDNETGMATWPRQPLVLVNEKATSTADLLKFKSKIVTKIKDQFGIELKQEPELLP